MPVTASAAPNLHTLYKHHHSWLYALLRRRLGHAGDAADLAHDVFVRLLTAPRRFEGETGARAYLSTMARGLCIDLWRRREIEQAWLQALAAQPEAQEPSAEARAIVFEALRQVDDMLCRLPARTAEAFVMAMACGMTDKEIGQALGISDRMVRKHTARAMLHCAQLLAPTPSAAPCDDCRAAAAA